MKVITVGAAGQMVQPAIDDLLSNEIIDDLILADIDAEGLATVLNRCQDPRVRCIKLNISDSDELTRAMEGMDGVLNGSWYEFNLPVMQAAAKTGTHYVDLGGLYHITLKQLELDEAFKNAGVTAIVGIGASPGITNVAVAMGAKGLDEVHEIHIRTGAKGGKGFAYSARTILDEVTMSPIVFEEGQLKTVAPLSGRERYVLPDPVGEVEGFYSIHSELATLPFVYKEKGIRTVTFRVAFSPKLVQIVDTLVDLGLTSEEALVLGDCRISPRQFIYAHLSRLPKPGFSEEWKSFRVEVSGKKDGMEKTYVFETVVASDSKAGYRATQIWTGIPAATALKHLLLKEPVPGVHPPETGLDASSFIQDLADKGILIEKYSK